MASRSTFGRDTGLQTRMLFTIFLLGAVYVVFIGVLFAAGASAVAIVFFAAVLFLIQLFGFLFGGGGGYGNDDDDGPGWMVVLLVSLAVYAISFVLMQALSRYREFAADRGAAVLTGRPSALASALLKISGTMQRIPTQ